uniref:ATP synthase F0 subunit 8 n=1 Tax=Asthenactis papyraceus TaxID=2939277 RepID=UPI0020278E6A|nr:ATP synthase F0 subunit 8 [Asthenactis papyraceus]UPP55882.1 ATP synthase F0 subunit 8 [Asthenactis papyraceus]
MPQLTLSWWIINFLLIWIFLIILSSILTNLNINTLNPTFSIENNNNNNNWLWN